MMTLGHFVVRGLALFAANRFVACVTVLFFSCATFISTYFNSGNTSDSESIVFTSILSLFVALVIQPYFNAGLMSSFKSVLLHQNVDLSEFLVLAQRYFYPIFKLALVQMFIMGLTLNLSLAFVRYISGELESFNSGAVLHLSGAFFNLILVPLFSLAPVVIVVRELSPYNAIKTSYNFVFKNFVEFIPFLVIFWGIPVFIEMGAKVFPEVINFPKWGIDLLYIVFMVSRLPILVVYLDDQLGLKGQAKLETTSSS